MNTAEENAKALLKLIPQGPQTREDYLELETRLLAHLRGQMETFGSTMVDYYTLRDIVQGEGDYAAIDHREVAWLFAEQGTGKRGWKLELLPDPPNKGADAATLAPLRFFDPQRHTPAGPVARWDGLLCRCTFLPPAAKPAR